MTAKLTYLGHAAFLIHSGDQRVLIDPWVMGNPACPGPCKTFDRLDIMLITHGHFDHIGDAVEIARKHNPKVVAVYETCQWLGGKGIENTLAMNKGGTQVVDGLRVTMVHADHSCGILDEGKIIYGGEAVGYVVELEGGVKLYHAGDTNIFGDMRLIGELYAPDVALLPIGDLYTMGPKEAAYACKLLGAKKVVPMHYATFPALTGTPAQLRDMTREIEGLKIFELKPGESMELR